MIDTQTQPVRGIVPPAVGEARIGVRWPSVARSPGIANLGKSLVLASKSFCQKLNVPSLIVSCLLFSLLLPVAFLIALAGYVVMAPLYFSKLLPVTMTRYFLTNRRLMIQKGWSLKPALEVKLGDISDVRVVQGSENPFFGTADLEILNGDRVALTLTGVKDYKPFIHTIQNAHLAWGRKEGPKEQFMPASAMK